MSPDGRRCTRCLTFDMSGRPQTAKLAVGCPLDGGVRAHGSVLKAKVCRATSFSAGLPWRVTGAIAQRHCGDKCLPTKRALAGSTMRVRSTRPLSLKCISTTMDQDDLGRRCPRGDITGCGARSNLDGFIEFAVAGQCFRIDCCTVSNSLPIDQKAPSGFRSPCRCCSTRATRTQPTT